VTVRFPKRLIAVGAIVLVAALAAFTIAACGGEEEAEPTAEPTTATAEPSATEAGAGDVVDVLQADGRFTELTTAMQTAGLVRIGYGLKGEGPLTVFAPTDEAFAKVPKDQLEALLADPMGALQQVLTYHVAEGEVMSGDITDGMEVTTLQGEPVTFTVKDGKVMVDGAEVIEADIEASNGVIHVIDAVMVPPSLAGE